MSTNYPTIVFLFCFLGGGNQSLLDLFTFRMRGAEGVEMIPHYSFWISLPAKTKVQCRVPSHQKLRYSAWFLPAKTLQGSFPAKTKIQCRVPSHQKLRYSAWFLPSKNLATVQGSFPAKSKVQCRVPSHKKLTYSSGFLPSKN